MALPRSLCAYIARWHRASEAPASGQVWGHRLSKSDEHVRYKGRWFSAASELPVGQGLRRPRVWLAFVAAALRRPWRIVALILLLVRTPSEQLWLSDSSVGRAIGEYLSARSGGLLPRNRFWRGVLILPGGHADHLRGRHRQAVRTNLRKAAAAGIRCEVPADRAAAADLVAVLGRRDVPLTEAEKEFLGRAVGQRELTQIVARDRSGALLAVAGVLIDDTVCLIRFALACDHDARWALHDHLVRILIARGVRYVVAEGGGPFGALALAPGTQHYQHLLGYQLRHVIPRTEQHQTSWRRVIAAAAVSTAACLVMPADAIAAAIC